MANGNVRVPVRTDGLTMIFSGCEPAADYNSGEFRTDRATGQPIYRVFLTVILPGEVRPQVWVVSVVGEPKGIQPGDPVRVAEDCVASEWDIDGRHGIGFRASSVAPLNSAGRSTAAKADAA